MMIVMIRPTILVSFCSMKCTQILLKKRENSSGGMRKRVKKNPRTKEESSSDHSHFVAHVSLSSLKNDRLYVTKGFASSNGLDKMSGKEIVLLNEEGRSWNLNMTYNKAGMHTFIRPGWRRFCAENGMNQGHHCTFKLVRKSAPPVLRLSRAGHEPKPAPEPSLHHSYYVGTVSSSSLKTDRLYLQMHFVTANGLDKRFSEITVQNEWGGKWSLGLRHYKSVNHTYLGPGWKTFCQVNGIKARDSFMLKLVETGDKPALLLCSSNRGKTPLECSEDSDAVNSLSSDTSSEDDSREESQESEEESIEDKDNSQECMCSSPFSKHRFVRLTLTQSAFKTSVLYLQRKFVTANGLEGFSEITLKNQWGGRWTLRLRYYESLNHTYLGPGWKTFCQVNGIKAGDSFMFKVVETGNKPALLLCSSNCGETPLECSKDCDDVHSLSSDTSSEEESSLGDEGSSLGWFEIEKEKNIYRALSSDSQDRFVKLTVTPRALKTYKLMLPLDFTRVNGINKPGKITLLYKDGVKKQVVDLLDQNRKTGIMRLGKGWREFCDAHGVKVGESFLLELMWDEEAIPMLKFCTKL
ncbi:unnamed protein product [Eruca vesicaria subsp. sativa]|uniref:TF-B3 domain-containing protein n=1 Tax=Eruca vesicaria subsp. sativa TaxID=29727 RepID=A0ABC8M1Y5_ERUVS|nr:unnamed protein product [Eruca vesicaria subsp. sativa]